ncbi:helix-turn-helix domain-containing protein [Clostridium botulinum]|nr:helix-turn-helix domain-containing protein [Clostridium botulinum]
MNILNEVMTFAEASKKWGLGESTLRSAIHSDRFIENIDYKKSGKVWLITKEAMERVYGESKK